MATIQDNRAATISAASRFSTSVGLLLLRVPIGLYFILAGIAKIRSAHGGVGGFVNENIESARRFMSDNLAHNYLSSLPWVEIGIGGLLIVGLLTRVVSFLTLALLISFILGKTGLFIEQKMPTAHANIVMVGVTAALVFCGPGFFSLDGMLFRRRRVVVTEGIDTTRPAI